MQGEGIKFPGSPANLARGGWEEEDSFAAWSLLDQSDPLQWVIPKEHLIGHHFNNPIASYGTIDVPCFLEHSNSTELTPHLFLYPFFLEFGLGNHQLQGKKKVRLHNLSGQMFFWILLNRMPTLKIPMLQFNHNFLFNLKQQSAAASKYYSLFRQSVSNWLVLNSWPKYDLVRHYK